MDTDLLISPENKLRYLQILQFVRVCIMHTVFESYSTSEILNTYPSSKIVI
jgi:hypothetical protein